MTYFNTRPTIQKPHMVLPETPPPSMRGLGDLVERVAEKTGVKAVVEKVAGKDCGCGRRRDKLNKAVPFGGKT